MPYYSFWYTDQDSIEWTFDRAPKVGEEVVLGYRGVYRVVSPRSTSSARDGGYMCELIRKSTSGDIQAMYARGINRLP
jgi:hypothetical protein